MIRTRLLLGGTLIVIGLLTALLGYLALAESISLIYPILGLLICVILMAVNVIVHFKYIKSAQNSR